MLVKLLSVIRRLASDSRGTAQIEYVMIAVLVAIGSLGALTALADSVIGVWSHVEEEVVESVSGSAVELQQQSDKTGLGLGKFNPNKGKGQGKNKDKGKKPKG